MSLSCTVTGRFEGEDLRPNSPCAASARGRLVALAPGAWTPDCLGGARVESDDAAITLNGTRRTVSSSSIIRIDGSQMQMGSLDDQDEDADPAGDHAFVMQLSAMRAAPAGPGAVPCVTTPLKSVDFLGNATIT